MTERAFFMCYFRNKTNEWQSKNLITIIKLKNTAHAFRPRTKLPLNMEPLKHSGCFLVGIKHAYLKPMVLKTLHTL
jgi:hypothetical protein